MMMRLMEEILHQLRLVIYPIIYKVLYIQGGAGFQPSTVCICMHRFSAFFHATGREDDVYEIKALLVYTWRVPKE